jgi:hypothetical protein
MGTSFAACGRPAGRRRERFAPSHRHGCAFGLAAEVVAEDIGFFPLARVSSQGW